MIDLVPRSTWCPEPPPARSSPHLTGSPLRAYVHHGAAGRSTIATARGYVRHHVRTNGWADVGYHVLIAEGTALQGRPITLQGAHVRGDNSRTTGLCVVGSYTSRDPADRDLAALVEVLVQGRRSGLIAARLLGHRDGGATSCPGDRLYRALPEVRRAVDAQLAAPPPRPPAPIPLPEPTEDEPMRLIQRDQPGGTAYVPDATTRTLHPLNARWQADAITGDPTWHSDVVVVTTAELRASGWAIARA